MDLTKIIDYDGSKDFFDYSSGNRLQGYVYENNSFFYGGTELSIRYLLGESENDVYDLKNYNKFYNNKKDYVAIGVLLGDDTFGYYKGGPEIYIHLNTGSSVDGEVFAIVAESLEEFLSQAFNL